MATLADLTASTRRTTGQRPPPLVGASTTVVGCKLFLFGGRLVPTRTMVNTLYVLDLESLVWEQLWPPADRAVRVASNEGQEGMEELEDGEAVKDAPLRGPQARYFHSCDVHGDLLLIFGGMGYQHAPSRPESPAGSVSSRNSGRSRQSKSPQQDAADPGLCVLADLIIYDTVKNTWSFPSPPVVSTTAGSPNTSPHSATMPLGPSPRYAHLSCISNSCLVILGGQDLANRYLQEISVLDLERMVWVETRRYDGHCGTYRSVAVSRPMSVHYPDASKRRSRSASIATPNATPDLGISSGSPPLNGTNELVQLPFSAQMTKENPEPIFLYSNFNFSAVRRALDLVSAPKAPSYSCPVAPLSQYMSSGPSLPPGLRFPTGAIVGGHLVIAGTFLSHALSCFAIWALDLANHARGGKLSWSKIDPGGIMSGGASWNRAVAWRNSIVVLGDRDRHIAEDYDHRQTNFSHCAFIDLEAFGIYHPPLRLLPTIQQELGLAMLSNRALCDFDLVCADGVRLPCSRTLLEQRWPWFAAALLDFRARARATPTFEQASDVRLTPRELLLPEHSDVALSALQYFYSLSLSTPLQHQLGNLVGLLVFSKTYDIPNLRALAVHALHCQLATSTGSGTMTAQVYEAATLSGALALQIRSLKTLMQANRSKGGRDPTQVQPQVAAAAVAVASVG